MAGKTLVQQLADLEAMTDKTPEQVKAVEILKDKIAKQEQEEAKKVAEAEEKAKLKKDAEEAEKKKFKEAPNDFQDYQKLGELKFLQWKEDKFERKCLKPKTLKQFEALEKKFKDYPGKIPTRNKTVHIGIGIPNVRVVKGFGVPESLYKLFVDAENIDVDKYFE